MPINSIDTASKWSSELDKAFVQKSATGFLADNLLRAKFVGAKTVVIPNIDFVGLVDYDKDNGFNRSALTVANESFVLGKDRARSIQLDREDEDETGIADLAGKILGEFVRTKVVPECDAYVLSKLAGVANTGKQKVAWNAGKPYETFVNLVNKVRSVVGYDEELVCFVNGSVIPNIELSTELQKMINVADFKQGDVNFKVKHINGVPLIPVTPERMKTAYTYANGESGASAGGFDPDPDAKDIYMLVLPKKAASLVRKTEKMRIFTPDQNQTADAYKFDYRIYYDVFVKKSGTKAIWASVEE